MKISKKLLALAAVLALVLSGCGVQKTVSTIPDDSGTVELDAVQTPTADETVMPIEATEPSEMFTDRDQTADYGDGTRIELNGDAAACSSDAVQISGSTVTITDEGTYILSGTLNDGQIIVKAEATDKPQLVLDGVSIHCETGAPITILEADKVVITLSEGSENALSNGGSFTAMAEANVDGTVFSSQDLTFNGSGSLSIDSPVGHGIVCKDDLVFTGGTYAISAASHGIDANDSVRATGAALTITSGKDGIHAENADDASLGFVYVADGTIHIEAIGDGISAGSELQIEDGSFNILSGGGSANAAQHTSDFGGFGKGQHGMMGGNAPSELAYTTAADTEDTSAKALKAVGSLLIQGGNFTIDAADDAVHSNATITVDGGVFDVQTGDDGFHADETLTVAGGEISISVSYEGMEGQNIQIAGGEISIIASDDGMNVAGGTDQSGFGGPRGDHAFGSSSGGSLTISGGSVYINASGDGLDSNGSLEISGGDVVVSGPTTGDTSVLDFGGSGIISGGTFIGTGGLQMAQTLTSSTQGVLSLNAGNQPAGTELTLTDSAGNVILSHETDQASAYIILSSSDMEKGETYSITIGDATGEFAAE